MTTKEQTIADRVWTLSGLRQAHMEAGRYLGDLRAEWETEHAEAIDRVKNLREEIEAVELAIRDLALAEYGKTGDPKVVVGVEVKVFGVLDYAPQAALAWAKEHGVALSLNIVEFAAIMKATGDRPEFVTLKDEPRAQIASALGKHLVCPVCQEASVNGETHPVCKEEVPPAASKSQAKRLAVQGTGQPTTEREYVQQQ